MNNARLQDAIAAQYRSLADSLTGQPATAWDAQSLCAGWRVREVVAHVTMPFRYSTARFAVELVKARGNVNRMADRCARRDAALSTGDLVAALRDDRMHAWKPPGGGYEGALVHAVIHTLDITVPLHIEHPIPEEPLRAVLGGVTKPNSRKFFGADLTDIELRADDIDWSFGSGVPLVGSARHLALVLCGRRLPSGLLHGEPCARFDAA